jgi:hypothetical protein
VRYLIWQQITYCDPDTFEEHLDGLMEALLDLERCDEDVDSPDVAASLTSGDADVQMTVEAPSPAEAAVKAQATLRAAVHAIGDATPGWETVTSMHVAPADAGEPRVTAPA